METGEHLRQRTIRDFGEQWTRYRENDGYYGSAHLLADIVEPLLPLGELRGKRVADIGSGTGRIVNMLLDAGVAHVVAVEPSAAFDVLRANVSDRAAVTLINATGDRLPPSGDLDVVVSIGVLHHIPDPAPVLAAAYRALKPGGRMLAWLYGRENNETYLALAEPLRAFTRRVPHPILVGLVHLLYPVLAGYIALARRFDVPLRDYLNNYLAKLSPAQRRLVMYDQLNPAYAKYYTQREAVALLGDAGFANVRAHHRHGYSWTVIGDKPLNP
ncbi:MAG TPA: class I SAM-dependent methyltransferase [Burkholderiales bacterium]|nr:class I SAM-dependent methyltransferase [Burkholderiales bacterium]